MYVPTLYTFVCLYMYVNGWGWLASTMRTDYNIEKSHTSHVIKYVQYVCTYVCKKVYVLYVGTNVFLTIGTIVNVYHHHSLCTE